MKDLGIRVISGIIGLALLIGIVQTGGITLKLSILIISIIGMRELMMAFEHKGLNPMSLWSYLLGTIYILTLGTYGTNFSLIMTGFIMIGLITMLNEKYNVLDLGVSLLSFYYIPFLIGNVLLLDKTKYIWVIFTIAFGTDVFAYFAGNLFGKHKLAPKISPNKTIEGSVGGILGSLILTVIYGMIFNLPYLKLIPLAIVGSIISQLGDLAASSIKRWTGIKDYGFIIPGHGGVLDRFDSIIFTTPVVYYYVQSIIF